MRNLQRVLELLNMETPMEYCIEFDEIKSQLEYCDRNVKPFKKLHFRGGNEQIVKEICRRLKELLSKLDLYESNTKPPSTEKCALLRKILMFLLANTDVFYKYNLREDPQITHVVEVCPIMPKFLVMAIIWDLHLDYVFYEMLSYTPCWFAFQHFEAASESLKYVNDPYDVLEKVESLIRAVIINMARSVNRQMDTIDTKIIFGKIYDYTINILRLFHTPDSEKFKNFSQDNLHRYSGFAIKRLLDLILFAFDVYEKKDVNECKGEYDIYDVCRNLYKQAPSQNSVKNSEFLRDHQLKIILAILNSLQHNLMLVNVDAYMYWVEIDLDESENMNLQMYVGQKMYIADERMMANEEFNHGVQKQFQTMKLRPKTEIEIIKSSSIGQILRALSDPNRSNKALWLTELLSHQIAFISDECVETMQENIHLFSQDHCNMIMEFMKLQHEANAKVGGMELVNNDELINIMLRALDNLSNKEILDLLLKQLSAFGLLSEVFCRANFQQRAVEFINRMPIEFELKDFLALCFEYPNQTWKLFMDKALSDEQYVPIFCSVVNKTRDYSINYADILLTESINDESKVQSRNFPEFLSSIYQTVYTLDRSPEFLKKFVNDNVDQFLDSNRYECLLAIVKSIYLIAVKKYPTKPCFGNATPPAILKICQIMERSRWDFLSYTCIRDEIVCKCIEFLDKTCKNFATVATDKDRQWLTQKAMLNFRPYTLYYLQPLIVNQEELLDFDKFLLHEHGRLTNTSSVDTFLIKTIVRCTDAEIQELACNEKLLDRMEYALTTLAQVAKKDSHGIANHRRCLLAFRNILLDIVIPRLGVQKDSLEKLYVSTINLIGECPKETHDEIFLHFEPMLADLFKNCANTHGQSEFWTVIENMKDCPAKTSLIDKMKDSTTS